MSAKHHWQRIIWQEWRASADADYGCHLLNLVASNAVGKQATSILLVYGALFGLSLGIFLAFSAQRWPTNPKLIMLFSGICILLGLSIAALIITFWAAQQSWQAWLAWLSPNMPPEQIMGSAYQNRGAAVLVWSAFWLSLTQILSGCLWIFVLIDLGTTGFRLGLVLAAAVTLTLAGAISRLGAWLGGLMLLLSYGITAFLAGLSYWQVGDIGLALILMSSVHSGILIGLLGRDLNTDHLYPFRVCFFWWPTPPPPPNLENALRQACWEVETAWTIWAKPLRDLQIQKESYPNLKALMALLASRDWRKRFVARQIYLSLGQAALSSLQGMATRDYSPAQKSAQTLLKQLKQAKKYQIDRQDN